VAREWTYPLVEAPGWAALDLPTKKSVPKIVLRNNPPVVKSDFPKQNKERTRKKNKD